jgi:hypothetical protein
MTGSLLSNVVLAHCGQDLAQKDLARKVLARKVLARKVLARNSAIPLPRYRGEGVGV